MEEALRGIRQVPRAEQARAVTEEEAKKVEGCAVVVKGAMNPAIHHPSWYKVAEILVPELADEALQGDFVFVPPLSQFTAGKFQVLCQNDRWQITLADLDDFAEGIEIAARVFDDALHETPLTAAGLNFHFHWQTARSDVAQYLAEQVSSLPFGLSAGEPLTATVIHHQRIADGILRATIEPSKEGPAFAYAGFNAHYEISPTGEPARFSLRELLCERLAAVRPIIDLQLEQIRQGFAPQEA